MSAPEETRPPQTEACYRANLSGALTADARNRVVFSVGTRTAQRAFVAFGTIWAGAVSCAPMRPHMRRCCRPFGLAALGLVGSIRVGQGRLRLPPRATPSW